MPLIEPAEDIANDGASEPPLLQNLQIGVELSAGFDVKIWLFDGDEAPLHMLGTMKGPDGATLKVI